MIIIRSVPRKAASTLLGIVERASTHVRMLGTFQSEPSTIFVDCFAEYQSGRDALTALDKISVWVEDKWPVNWGPRPSVRTNLGREAKSVLSFVAGRAFKATSVLTRPAGSRAWGAASTWREHDVDLAVTVD